MGYYSQVSILMDKESTDEFIKKLANEMPEHLGYFGEALEEGFKTFGIDETKPYRIFHFEWTKWYDDMFPEIQFMMRFLRNIEEPHYYDFMRLGEDMDDVEHEYSYDCYFGVTRDVVLEEP